MELSSSLVLVLILVVLMVVRWKRKASGLSLPPGPLALPLVGNLPIMDKRAPFKSFMQWSKTYGSVMTVYLGSQRMVVLVGYDTVKEALVDQAEHFTGRAPIPFLIKIMRGYAEAFTLTTLRDFGMGRKRMEQWIQEESRHLLKSFEETNATPVDPVYFLSRTVSNVICSLVFGQRFDYEDKNFLHLLQIISRLLRFVSSPQGQLYNVFPKLMHLLPGRHHGMFKEIEDVKAFVMQKIKEHEQNLDFSDPKDFIDCFLIRRKQDTVIIPMLHSVLRDEGQWEAPWTFKPEHFLDANGNFKKNPAFIPFSAGKRSCVGESLARMELFLFIVSLLQKFKFSSPKGPDGVDPSPELSSFGNIPRFYDLIASPRWAT
ncbi:Cytochrome P450 2G1 [Labeo rohita]|uniref:Cytochrome P450 2G1 n=1 Tax=Labeo rohita TaxID=84645 RepID=A0ABQ8LAN0_LABRO|nr:Cytochrome P450 2G1 [Labeo rohita]